MKIITPTWVSSRAKSKARFSSATVEGRNAFLLSGLLIVICETKQPSLSKPPKGKNLVETARRNFRTSFFIFHKIQKNSGLQGSLIPYPVQHRESEFEFYLNTSHQSTFASERQCDFYLGNGIGSGLLVQNVLKLLSCRLRDRDPGGKVACH